MPLDVAVYAIRDHHRSQLVAEAMAQGLRRLGQAHVRLFEDQYCGYPQAQVAVFYGLEGRMPMIFEHHRRLGHRAVYVDLGYWGRRAGGRWAGYHKVAVNARHPTEYFRRRPKSAARRLALKVHPQPWKSGTHVLLAGMGDKGAHAEGFHPEQWERKAIAKLKQYTDRPIVYRPKPSWKTAKPIPGVAYSPRTQEIEEALAGAHAVVTHHSNVAVDGLISGTPAFCWAGVAQPLASQHLAEIEQPPRPEGREQWASDVAYCQWSIEEMKQGLTWRYLLDEGLLL